MSRWGSLSRWGLQYGRLALVTLTPAAIAFTPPAFADLADLALTALALAALALTAHAVAALA